MTLFKRLKVPQMQQMQVMIVFVILICFIPSNRSDGLKPNRASLQTVCRNKPKGREFFLKAVARLLSALIKFKHRLKPASNYFVFEMRIPAGLRWRSERAAAEIHFLGSLRCPPQPPLR